VAIQAAGHRHAVALENAFYRAALEELNAILEARVAERTAEL
jgi:predicted DNA-binding ribbon-helix-helix protein